MHIFFSTFTKRSIKSVLFAIDFSIRFLNDKHLHFIVQMPLLPHLIVKDLVAVCQTLSRALKQQRRTFYSKLK